MPIRIAFTFEHANKSYDGTYELHGDTKIEVATPFGTKLCGNEPAGAAAKIIAIQLARRWRTFGKRSSRPKR
jgi:hypothetical protein